MALLDGKPDGGGDDAGNDNVKDTGNQDAGNENNQGDGGDAGNPEWNKDIDESMRGRVDKFKDVSSLAKGYMELEDKLSAGFKMPESDEEKSKLWAKLGRPTDAEGYELDGDDEIGFRAHAFELGLSQEQVTQHSQWFKNIVGRYTEQKNETSKASEVTLREKWGDKFKENMALANRELGARYSENLIDRLEQGGFLDDIEIIGHLHGAGKRAADDSIGSGGSLVEVERTEAGQPYLDFPSMKEYD